jgi:hypothetical protein
LRKSGRIGCFLLFHLPDSSFCLHFPVCFWKEGGRIRRFGAFRPPFLLFYCQNSDDCKPKQQKRRLQSEIFSLSSAFSGKPAAAARSKQIKKRLHHFDLSNAAARYGKGASAPLSVPHRKAEEQKACR